MISGVFVVVLGRAVVSDLDALSTAQNDDISWNISQLEVELLKLQNVTLEVMQDPDTDLASFRKRYDIFYSRLSNLSQGRLFHSLRERQDVQAALRAANSFLEMNTPVVDGPDNALRFALADIRSDMIELSPLIRNLALGGVEHYAQNEAMRRDKLSQTLIRLAAAILVLILALAVTAFVLLKLFRTGERYSHENAVMRSRFEAAVNSSLDAVLVVNTKGQIIEFNGSAESVFGYSRKEAIGGDMADLIVPEHMRDMHRKGMQRFLATNEQKVIGAGRLRLEGLRKSGEIFPVELSISLAETEGERVFVSFLRDITQELKAEEDLRTARDKAQESEKAKSDLLTVMSHEMRTPLNGILGSLSLIDQDNLTDRQKRHLNSIAVSGDLLLSHVNDVLHLSSLTAENSLPEQSSFNLQDVIDDVADSLRANAQARNCVLHVNALSGLPRLVRGHKTSLQQCLVNLVGNAIKFTTDGTVIVEIEKLPDDRYEIRVSDTGVGIAPQNLPRIFEEFVTIDTAFARENTGTGLGLAITKRLVEAMRGEIEVDSVLGEGSLFTLRIPLEDLDTGHDPDTPKLSTAITSLPPGLRALVVDDNEINRMILVDMLQDMQFVVMQAADGYEAIDLVAQHPFDILLLDISMPGIDGTETLDQIRLQDTQWNRCPAIAVTAHAAKQDHDTIMQADFSDLLVKPVDPLHLKTALKGILIQDAPQDESGEENNARLDFIERFGHKVYMRHAQDLGTQVSELAQHLATAKEPSAEIRQTAHKLAGTAAVLGKVELTRLLQTVEGTSQIEWAERREQILLDLADAVDQKT
ncbi:Autoinducer 2 sensor kinase/phosphatase LuxQ [Falsiruegeria litorea R37]|uniref:histidine kinase n=2 Tax=Falsiruegeria litorea TaxID=1280831 RepID=A0A1Y5TJ83_9RHOB|nr:Autoinducer 2 sensor kinase/phosphatase LuxQ [Falsiruegeria litorea R37]